MTLEASTYKAVHSTENDDRHFESLHIDSREYTDDNAKRDLGDDPHNGDR